MEMVGGEEVIDIKIIIEMTVEIEGDKILEEASVIIEVDQEKEAWHQEDIVIEDMTVQMQIQGLEVDWIQELQQTEIGLDALDVENMITLPMNVWTWVQMIQIGMNQTELLYN